MVTSEPENFPADKKEVNYQTLLYRNLTDQNLKTIVNQCVMFGCYLHHH